MRRRPIYPPSRYFKMAEEIREIADQIDGDAARQAMIEVAEDYDRMGRAAQANEGVRDQAASAPRAGGPLPEKP
jgi:hypothetical protein